MKQIPSIRKNYIYNVTMSFINTFLSLITYPYITRVLGPESFGMVNFAASIANYFLLISSLGLPLYGMREIAKARNDREKLDRVFSELFFISIIFTVISLIFYILLLLFVPKIRSELPLYLVFGASILLNPLSMDWLYSGLEKYPYISLRNSILKVISTAMIFIAVLRNDDFVKYAAVSLIPVIGADVVNCFNLKNIVKLQWRSLSLKKHMPYLLTTFLIIFSLSLGLEKVILGFMTGDKDVGYYSLADKVLQTILIFITSISTVLMPRISNYFSNNKIDNIHSILNKSMKFIFLLSIPFCVCAIFLSDYLALFFGGIKFTNSVDTIKIMSPILVLTGLARLTGEQTLYSTGQERKYLFCIIMGIIVSLVLNILFIPVMKQNGSALALILSQFLVCILQVAFGWQYLKKGFLDHENLYYLISAVPMAAVIILCKRLNFFYLLDFIIAGTAGMIVYLGVLTLLKESLLGEIYKSRLNPFIKRS